MLKRFAITLFGILITVNAIAQEGLVVSAHARAQTMAFVDGRPNNWIADSSEVFNSHLLFPVSASSADSGANGVGNYASAAEARAWVSTVGLHAYASASANARVDAIDTCCASASAVAAAVAELKDGLYVSSPGFVAGTLVPVRVKLLLRNTSGIGTCGPDGHTTLVFNLEMRSLPTFTPLGPAAEVKATCAPYELSLNDTWVFNLPIDQPVQVYSLLSIDATYAAAAPVSRGVLATSGASVIDSFHTGLLVLEPLDAAVTITSLSGRRYQAEEDANYGFDGFLPPVENIPVLNRVKAGSAIPLKFKLGGDFGIDVLSAVPTSAQVACTASVTGDIAQTDTVTANASGLQFSPDTQEYTYVWKTEKSWAGTCREIRFTLKGDATVRRATFSFR